MQRSNQWLGYAPRVVMVIMASLQLTACQEKPEPSVPIDIATKVEDTGQALHRVRLTAKRAEELDIKTALVREEQRDGKLQRVIPAAAVVQDQQGNAWIFKSADSLVFVRERISVVTIDGDEAVLSDGPPVGTAVVSAGANRLFSDEFSESREGVAESKTSLGDKGQETSGMATMKEDGTIKLVYKTTGKSGLGASIVIEYKPQDEEYQKILDQVGGLKVGESKAVPALPERY